MTARSGARRRSGRPTVGANAAWTVRLTPKRKDELKAWGEGAPLAPHRLRHNAARGNRFVFDDESAQLAFGRSSTQVSHGRSTPCGIGLRVPEAIRRVSQGARGALAYNEAMPDDSDKQGLLTSIGYGDRPWPDFMERLRRHEIQFLIDVRSQPRSRQPEFNAEALELLLSKVGVRYVFMGDTLGGKPDDPSCYVDGKIDYARCEQRPAFQAGMSRLRSALAGGHRVALMCSELDPERCHRSKLIGQALDKEGIELTHIDRDGTRVTQRTVISRITGGQEALFGQSFTSVGRYVPPPSSEML